MSIIKKPLQAIGLAQEAPRLETKVPALQPTRESETGAEDITLGSDDDLSTAKGKRGLVRPVASSLGGV